MGKVLSKNDSFFKNFAKELQKKEWQERISIKDFKRIHDESTISWMPDRRVAGGGFRPRPSFNIFITVDFDDNETPIFYLKVRLSSGVESVFCAKAATPIEAIDILNENLEQEWQRSNLVNSIWDKYLPQD